MKVYSSTLIFMVLTSRYGRHQQVGLSRATRLAQGRKIKVNIHNPYPVQIDGEPWIQQPGSLEISHHGQVSLRF